MILKTSKLQIIDLINAINLEYFQEHGIMEGLRLEDVTFGPVTEVPDGVITVEGVDYPREVSVHVDSLPTSRYVFDQTIYYNRYDLAVLFAGGNEIPTVSAQTELEAIEHVNALLGVSFTEEDVSILEFSDASFDGTKLTLVAKPESYAYKGTKEFTLVQTRIPLATVIRKNILDGLNYPDTVVFSMPLILANQPAPAELTKPDGRFLDGTGIPTTNFINASNDKIALSMGVMRRGAGSPGPVPVVDGIATIALTETQDWAIPYGVASLDGSAPYENFDVRFKVTDLATNEALELQLVEHPTEAGKSAWLALNTGEVHANGPYTLDNSHNDDLTATANTMRLFWFVDHVFQETNSDANGTWGSFKVDFTASPKGAIGLNIVSTVYVVVERSVG